MRILQPEFPEPLYPADFSAAVSEYRDTEERIEQKIFKNFRAENERFGHAEFFGEITVDMGNGRHGKFPGHGGTSCDRSPGQDGAELLPYYSRSPPW